MSDDQRNRLTIARDAILGQRTSRTTSVVAFERDKRAEKVNKVDGGRCYSMAHLVQSECSSEAPAAPCKVYNEEIDDFLVKRRELLQVLPF